MAEPSLTALIVLAASIGLVHTLTGPDHYLPFIAMSRVGRWSLAKTMIITGLCGIGHVLSSVLLGIAGIVFGWAMGRLEWFEGWRGNIAGWLLLGFGLAYTVWAVRRLYRNRRHRHEHVHADGTLHDHDHSHHGGHVHVHGHQGGDMTPWILFTIFAFGPCEPLIPMLMFPAALFSAWGIATVTVVFGVTTIVTMMAVVAVGYLGMAQVSIGPLQRYSHVIAGLAIAVCGVAIQLGM